MKWLKSNAGKMSGIISLFVLGAFLAEFLYYSRVYSTETSVVTPETYDLVLMYTGSTDLKKAAQLAVAARVPLFVTGVVDPGESMPEAQTILGNLPLINNTHAQTTDQNARDTADLIHSKAYRRILLLTRWDHLPRALFLTSFYLSGSGVVVIPLANTPAPRNWWRNRWAWVQLFKFWGSLGRIVLHWVGIDNWPPPEWMP
jgi:uncharacterized SAM-binding protein YcdF (DUF218 family)